MNESLSKDRVEITSDISGRDGIGIEVYRDHELVLEIFRDDTRRTREVTLYKKDVDLVLIEESIEIFKKDIPWEFLD